MSAVSDYIHYRYSNYTGLSDAGANADYLAGVYSNSKVQQQYKLSTDNLNSKIKALFASKFASLKSDNIEGENEFFKLLDDIQNNVLPAAAQSMTQKISTTNLSRQDLASATKSANELQNVINIFENILQQITGGSYSENPIAVLTADMLDGNINISTIKEKYREAYIQDGTTFKVDDSYTRAVASHKNEINKLLANLSAIKNIQEGGMSNFDVSLQSQTINALIWSTYSTLNRIVGFVSEDTLAIDIEKYLNENLVKEIQNSNVEFISSTTGTEKGSIFNTQTKDISIQMNFQDMLNGKQGEVQISLPGITLKRTNIKSNNIAKIHVKTNTNLSNFLNNMNLNTNIMDFYQAYADYNMSIKRSNYKTALPADLNTNAAPAMENMYNYFHAAMLPMALAGSLDSEDFAYFMVINDKVYNVIEIIQKIADNNDYSFIESNLKSNQTNIKNLHNSYYQQEIDPLSNIEGETRSKMIRSAIDKSKITMQLNLALNNKI
jgi:hypothetical protein